MSDSLPTGFAALGLDPRLVAPLTAKGYTDPTPIQAAAIPPLLEGRDLIGLAATGTGKTAAFALPLLHRLAANPPARRPAALVLVPTRELAIQVSTAMQKYGQAVGTRVVAVYGGAGFADQVRGIRHGADVVVATPGRALDHLRRGTMPLEGVSAVILDEADEMLDMGFADDLEALLAATPAGRQTMLFSATMPPRIESIAAKYLSNPVRVAVAKPDPTAGAAPQVRETVYAVPREFKTAALARVLEFEAPTSAIVFCRTRHEADEVTDRLANRGHRPEALHGGLSQELRDRVMQRFRSGAVTVLVATDVAARGLDIGHLSHVINFGVPQTAETYVHRIGRVGRAGRAGVAITVADNREVGLLRGVERAVRRRLGFAPVPTAAQLKEKRLDRTRDELRELIRGGGLEEFDALLGPLVGEFSPQDIARAAAALAAKASRQADDGPDIPDVAPRHRDNGPPRDRPPGPPRRPRPGMSRVFVGVGREGGVRPRDLVMMFEEHVGITPREVSVVDIAERFSVVEVLDEIADDAIQALDGIRFRGRRVVVRRDRAEGPGRPHREMSAPRR